jgi:hypothetical protein
MKLLLLPPDSTDKRKNQVRWIQIIVYYLGIVYVLEGIYTIWRVSQGGTHFWFGHVRYYPWFGIALPLTGIGFIVSAYLLNFQKWRLGGLVLLFGGMGFYLFVFDLVMATALEGSGLSWFRIWFKGYLLYQIGQSIWRHLQPSTVMVLDQTDNDHF